MEMEDQRDNSKKRTRKRKTSSLLSLNNTTTIFPLLLAAATQLSNSHKNTPNNSSEILVKKCLTKLHQSLLSNIQNFPTSVLSLFPILVNSKCAGITRRSAEIVGLASLVSLDMNELVALDEGIVKGLILMLGSEKRKVSVAACNALLDLSSTLIGRRSLLEFSALEWFMWEGFAHVALHCWYKTQKQLHGASVEPLSGNLDLMSVTLLHLMIELIGASDSTLRKASLVGALILPLEIDDWLYLNQKTTFNHIIDQINKASMFLEVFRSVEVVIEKNEDPFHRMRWLRLLYQETETIQEHDWNVPLALGEFQNLFPSCALHKDMTEAAFMQIKSKFCDEVLFEDVIDSYKLLLEKYKKARKQYMNGMLSLHCNGFPSA